MKRKPDRLPLGRRVLRALLFGAGASVLRLVLQLAIQATLARLLVPEYFGQVALAIIAISFAERFLPLGINFALTQKSDVTVEMYQTGATVVVTVATITSVVYYNFANWFAVFFGAENLNDILRTLCILFPIKILSKLHVSYLQRSLRFNTLVVAELASYVLGYGVISLVFANIGAGAWSLIIALIGQTLILYFIVFLLSGLKLKPRFHIEEAKQIFGLGGGFLLAVCGNFFALQLDNMVIGRTFSDAALGFYSRAYQIITLPSTLFDSVVQPVLFPSLSKLQDDRERMRRVFLRGSSLVATLAFSASGLLYLLASDLIGILLGSGWESAIPLVQLLAFGLGPRTCYKIAGTVTLASGAVYRRAAQQWLYAGLVGLCTLIGVNWGLNGVAIGVSIALVGAYLLAHQLCLSILELEFRDLAKIHLPAIFLAVLVFIPSAVTAHFCHLYTLPSILTIFVVGMTATFAGIILHRFGIGFSSHSNDALSALVSALLKRRTKKLTER